MTLEEATAFIRPYCYDEAPGSPLELNLNDAFSWGAAYSERVPDDQIIPLGRLIQWYGYAGVFYWVSRLGTGYGDRSEFHDVNRMIEFVANEERIIAEIPDASARAYTRQTYTLGAPPSPKEHP